VSRDTAVLLKKGPPVTAWTLLAKTLQRIREVTLVGETRLDRDSCQWQVAGSKKLLRPVEAPLEVPSTGAHASGYFERPRKMLTGYAARLHGVTDGRSQGCLAAEVKK
jgi:hypothetical protein